MRSGSGHGSTMDLAWNDTMGGVLVYSLEEEQVTKNQSPSTSNSHHRKKNTNIKHVQVFCIFLDLDPPTNQQATENRRGEVRTAPAQASGLATSSASRLQRLHGPAPRVAERMCVVAAFAARCCWCMIVAIRALSTKYYGRFDMLPFIITWQTEKHWIVVSTATF